MGTNITGIGNANAIGFKSRVTGGTYFPPELKNALVGVWSAYGKSNDSTDRNIIKNKIKDRGGDFVISNAAFKLNSGFGKYETELSNTRIWTQSKETTSSPFSSNYNGLSGWIVFANTELTNSVDMPSFKIQVKGLLEGQELIYRYYDSTGQTNVYSMTKDGKYTLPADVRTAKPLTSNTSGFQIVKNETNTITITQIPSFEGAFVTDGVNDLITSTKNIQEMLGGSNEITVVSMIHQIGFISSRNYARNNYFIQGNDFLTNTISAIGKIGIYGYKGNLSNIAIVNDILGDKKDYSVDKANSANIDSVFSVNGTHSSAQLSSVAWYWTIIANKVLTTDQINQVIAYYNLDRCVEPTVLYDIKRQGLSNDTPDSDWYLKDFSKNGFDMSLFNFAKKGGSGVAAKQGESIKDYSIIKDEEYQELTIYNEFKFKIKSKLSGRYWTVQYINRTNTSYPVTIVIDKDAYWVNSTTYYDADNNKQVIRKNIPIAADTPTNVLCCGYDQFDIPEDAMSIVSAVSYIDYNAAGEITVEFIPSCKGGLITDGVNDYGKVTGLPIYKDYTVVTDREIFANIGAISSKNNPGAFVETAGNTVYSFGQATSGLNFISTRSISYLSKYSYCGQSITAGAAEDGTDMWLGTIRDNDTRFFNGAIYSLMSFPYSMSEFLIERQLKKHKLGTLYPDMVEFRPIVKSNPNITHIKYYAVNWSKWTTINVGDYIPIGQLISVTVNVTPLSEIASVEATNLENVTVHKSTGQDAFDILGNVTSKSPQKINITIDEYIRFEDIVQPYPSLFTLIDYDTEEVYSWGSKLKVGARFKGNVVNLLPNMYEWQGNVLYNGEVLDWNVKPGVVAKEMIFSWNMPFKYLIDNNEPKCILSPRLLRIPNSSYKILDHIPDISGHGNHGKINNSAYASMSGANGYLVDFNSWVKTENVTLTDNKITVIKDKITYPWISYVTKGSIVPTFKVNISGIPNGGRLDLFDNNGTIQTLTNGVNDIEGFTVNGATGFLIYSGVELNWSNLVIQQIGEYEGAYCLDGVDDFVTIPTTVGGKQVLMKVNWRSDVGAVTLYDQRLNISDYEFAIYNGTRDLDDNPVIAYQGRNNGQTYIDGILNSNIIASELKAITHNITITNELSLGINNTYPVIASTRSNTHFAQMSLYDFMLFDEISTDDKIKELNEYVGLSGNIFEFNPPTFTIDLPMAIKSIKVYQGGNEISPGYLYPNKDTEFEVYVSLNDGKYAVDTITVDGVEITKDRVVGEYNIFKFILNGSSEQKIKIHSYEYIMYEDINQPYPVIFKVKDRTTNQIYSWGDRIKIGSSIQLIHGENPNLLPELYSIISYTYEGNSYSYNQLTNLVITVTKTISVSCQKTWKLGSNEPKCILSPKRLKLANSSYKYLGYIPDISGNGNNGVFNNFEFAGMSGANGYPYDYNNSSFWADSSLAKVVSGELVEYFAVKNSTGFSNITSGVYKGKIKVTGVTKAISENKISRLKIYSNSTTDNELIDITQDGNYNIDIKGVDDANRVFFYAIPSNPNDTAVVRLTEPIYIEQVGNYEGSICFDGVDDYMDIPSLSIGGKQVLMKTNWLKSPTLLYDQRASGSFAILTTKEDDATNPRIAYQARNQDGKTYIDGIENNYIETYSLKGITHNITVTNPSAGSGVVPVIGANTGKSSSFAKMALYDFMLFDEVSTDEEIKQLNDIVGIEGGYVQKPPYYWDAYGKTNSDDDRSTIQQRGTAVGDYDITNYNHAYEGMSGYNGYPVVFGANKTWKQMPTGSFIWNIDDNKLHITKALIAGNGLLFSYVKLNGSLLNVKEIPSFKIKVSGLEGNSKFGYRYLATEDATRETLVYLGNGTHELAKSFAPTEALLDLTRNAWVGIFITPMVEGEVVFDCDITIEVLPEYENGLVYDGVDDYSENTSIPAFTDYTYIIKYEDFNNPNTGSCIQRKGSIKAGGGAFVQDHIYRGTKYQYNFGISSNIHKDDSIAFCTKTNYNGTAIPSGNNTDDTGFTIGKFDGYRKMVFYKEMLYPRTVNMLTINMIKNMMAEDGIIDIQGKLFTDKFTGDFNLDFNKDFLIGN